MTDDVMLTKMFGVHCPHCSFINEISYTSCWFCGSKDGWDYGIITCRFGDFHKQTDWYHRFKEEPEADVENVLKNWKMELLL